MDWYAKWFGSEYISLYSHRDLGEARTQVDCLLALIGSDRPLNILDIGCGFGRHVIRFLDLGHHAVGLDLSSALLEQSARILGSVLPLVRGDMRALPFSEGAFELLSNFFTGFGYFQEDQEHLELLQEWRRVQRRGGKLFLDYLNRENVIATLLPKSEDEDEENVYRLERTISANGRRVEKKIRIRNKKSGSVTDFEESVRMFTLAELKDLFRKSAYDIVETLGSFNGHPFTPEAERLLILAEAK